MKNESEVMVKVMLAIILTALPHYGQDSTAGEKARDGRFIAYQNGTVLDTRTNLMWAAKDNGEDIDLPEAKSYCKNYRGGGYKDWRLPTTDELPELYDSGKTYKSGCGSNVHLSLFIRISCESVWESYGAEGAPFDFSNGKRPWNTQSDGDFRVLPVRNTPELEAKRHVEAMKHAEEDRVSHFIADLTGKKSAGERGSAALQLGFIKDPSAVEPLIAVLKDADAGVRSSAAEALGEIRDRRAVNPLIAVLKDPDWDVREQAAGALGEIGDARAAAPLITAFKGADNHEAQSEEEALAKIGAPAVGGLIAALKDTDLTIRWSSAEALGKIGALAFDALIAALQDPDAHARWGAAKALGEMADPRAFQPLSAALKDTDAGVRSAAAEALGKIKDTRAIDPLVALFNDPENRVRMDAMDALAKFGTLALEPLLAALKSSDAGVRCMSARTLSEFKDPRTIDPLAGLLMDPDPLVSLVATDALLEIKDPRLVEPVLAALTKASDLRLRLRLIEMLILFNESRAIETLKTVPQGMITRAVGELIRRGAPGSEGALIVALNEFGNRQVAVYLLNCGNAKLEEAARAWGVKHGYHVTGGYSGADQPGWGTK